MLARIVWHSPSGFGKKLPDHTDQPGQEASAAPFVPAPALLQRFSGIEIVDDELSRRAVWRYRQDLGLELSFTGEAFPVGQLFDLCFEPVPGQ